MVYQILKNREVIDRIVAEEDFCKAYCIEKGCTYEAEPEPVEEPKTLTPAEQREQAYNTEATIEWVGEMITVTQAAQLWQYYAAEGSEKATKLQRLIAEAKQGIREKCPDE